MTDNEIVKAFELCLSGASHPCRECPLDNEYSCKDKLDKELLDLINRQKAEIERLREIISVTDKTLKKCATLARTEAIKEFAEGLKNRIDNLEYTANITRKTVPVETLFTQVNWVLHEVVPETIDNLAKEMTGETK